MAEAAARPIAFHGDSLEVLRGLPHAARRLAGHELHQVALGLDPSRWKPMRTVGPGAREIVVETHEHGSELQHRVIYVAQFEEAVHVLHAFAKKTRKTSLRDIALAKRRYTEMLQERRNR